MEFKPFKIGKYVLLERLAMGGMAEVYRAKAGGAGGFEKQLAIKRILPNYSQNDEFRRMFEYEARLSSMLTHANIVQIYDFVKSGETYLLAMEYVDGKNLRQFINKVKKLGYQLPVEYGVFIINEVCKGLEYAHKKRDDVTGRPLNIIHRDMSPQNVMLSYDGAIKIVDFGIAKAKDRVDETRSGVIKGKFGYMSPEQANGEPVDHRTDIFSTGIILYELLTGRRLFSADNDMATLKLIQECVVPPPSKFNPKITPELEKIILKSLTKDLNLRFQSAGAFNRQLQEFMAKYFPTFGQKDLGEAFGKVFKEEIGQEKRRFEQIYRQSIPFSQGATEEGSESIEAPEEGSVTNAENREKTAVTSSDMINMEEDGEDIPSLPASEQTVVSSSYDMNAPSEPDRLGTKGKDQTHVEHVLEDTSISTLGPGSWNEKKPDPSPDKTVVEDPSISKITPTEAATEPRTQKDGTTGVKKSASGIDLDFNLDNDTRRRERSISALNKVSSDRVQEKKEQKEQSEKRDSIPAASSGLTFEVPRTTRPLPGPGPRSERPMWDDEEPQSKGGFGVILRGTISIIALGIVVAFTISMYNSYLRGEVPAIFRGLVKAPPAPRPRAPGPKAAPEEGPVQSPDRKISEDCALKVESDPAGATVVVGSEPRGTTPTSLPLECGGNFNITVRKDGYEGVSENIVMKKSKQSLFKQLKRIPMGTLVLSVDLNVNVIIDEIKFERYVKFNESVEIPLPANRKFKIKFKNTVYNVDAVQEVLVQEDERSERRFRLGDRNISSPK